MDLDYLRDRNRLRQTEWDPHQKLTDLFYAVELAGEVGEVCNVIKKLERERQNIPGSRDLVSHLEEELADVILVADLLAMVYGIDLSRAIKKKFNATSEKRGFQTRMP
jgi:NTP pyrophosphatase (non-canonical NTP hydrolase)